MSSTIISNKISSGYSWTLTTKLGHMIKDAEALFGTRDPNFTILGIEFWDEGFPNIWYPGECNHIAIRLTKNCLLDFNEGVFQLAHEVVHCIGPGGGFLPVNVLEEGMATYFSVNYTKKSGHGDYSQINDMKYKRALDLFTELYKIDSQIINKTRKYQSTISLIKVEDILKANPQVPYPLAHSLILPIWN